MKNVKPDHQRPVVCLDAGHYGKYNRSPVVPAYYESEMNWKLHEMLKAELEKYGIEVVLTREEPEKDLNVYYRGTASEGADLLLSIHSNAAQRESADYPAVYVPLDGKGHALGGLLAKAIRDRMDTVEPEKVSTREGKNGDYYGVIRGATAVGTVGLILEHSFHTNKRAAMWLLEDENLRAMAQDEAKVVAQWFGMAEEPEKWYRIRKSWEDAKSQTAAYQNLEGAIKACPVGYSVFDWEGNEVYTNYPNTEKDGSSYQLGLQLLRSGDRGNRVKALQLLLMDYGFPCGNGGADGIFGGDTQAALIAYQKSQALLPDGIAGEETMKALLGY